MKKNYKIKIDIFRARSRRVVKKYLPDSIRNRIDYSKQELTKNAAFQLLSSHVPPWSSPNIWDEIISFYNNIDRPRVFEFGTGASTIWHIETISVLNGGGFYTGIELDPTWYWVVVAAVIKQILGRFKQVNTCTVELPFSKPDKPSIDTIIKVDNIDVILKLRTTMEVYINALDNEYDVVIVDGAFRKKSVQKVLTTNNLRAGGLLMLMEAGRGSPYWWEGKLNGENDYSDEVNQMLSLGGDYSTDVVLTVGEMLNGSLLHPLLTTTQWKHAN